MELVENLGKSWNIIMRSWLFPKRVVGFMGGSRYVEGVLGVLVSKILVFFGFSVSKVRKFAKLLFYVFWEADAL